MKKTILITAIAVTGLFADAMTDMALNAAKSQAESEVKSQIAKSVTGDSAVKKEISETSATDAKSVAKDKVKEANATKETSLKDQAIDTVAEEAEKAVGKETLKKETAKSAIKSVI